MKKTLILTAFLAALPASAGDFTILSCWKGYNQKEQNENMKLCRSQRGNDQKCSSNIWEHSQAAYDVCLLAPRGELKLISLYKGLNQKEQDANLKECLKQESQGTICITNIWTHKQAAYDVALMTPVANAKPATNLPKKNIQAKLPSQTNEASIKVDSDSKKNRVVVITDGDKKNARFLSNGYNCFPVDKEGEIFGHKVDDSFCHKGFLSNGYKCFNVDASGTIYGKPVLDSYCRMNTLSNGYECYSQDAQGVLYGHALPDQKCQVSYSSNGYKCYPADRMGTMYGKPVDDSLCQK